MNDLRITEVWINKRWKPISFEEIKKDSYFRLFEPTGEPVLDNNENSIFLATSEPYLTKDGVFGIDVRGGD